MATVVDTCVQIDVRDDDARFCFPLCWDHYKKRQRFPDNFSRYRNYCSVLINYRGGCRGWRKPDRQSGFCVEAAQQASKRDIYLLPRVVWVFFSAGITKYPYLSQSAVSASGLPSHRRCCARPESSDSWWSDDLFRFSSGNSDKIISQIEIC